MQYKIFIIPLSRKIILIDVYFQQCYDSKCKKGTILTNIITTYDWKLIILLLKTISFFNSTLNLKQSVFYSLVTGTLIKISISNWTMKTYCLSYLWLDFTCAGLVFKVATGVSPQFFSIWTRVLNHNIYVEIKQFSKVDIKQNNISTVILLRYLFQVSRLSMRSAPFARKSGCLHIYLHFIFVFYLISNQIFVYINHTATS